MQTIHEPRIEGDPAESRSGAGPHPNAIGRIRRLPAVHLLTQKDLDRFLERTISLLRWATILVVLLISLVKPPIHQPSVSEWTLVAVFGASNLLVDLIRWASGRHAFIVRAVLDLALIGAVYTASTQPGGPIFALLVLVTAQTTAFMTLTGSLLYAGAAVAIAAVAEPRMLGWSSSDDDLRGLAGRLVALTLVGIGMGMLTRRMEHSQQAARSVLNETERLDALADLRAAFVLSVSHELRTPLTAARAGLGLLEASVAARLQGEEQDLLANTRRNVERLNHLIDDLLTSNHLESGSLRLDRRVIDLRLVVADAMAAIHPLTEAKGQTMELDLPEPLPHRGDARRLEQAVLNVVVNAHRHTPAGGRIVISGRNVENEVVVSVADNGPGIPQDELEAIFTRFHRLATSDGGSGLGLAVARGIVELHGGRLWAASVLGQGAAFHLALPRAEPEAEEPR